MTDSSNQPAAGAPQKKAHVSAVFALAVLLPVLGYVGYIGLAEAKRWSAPTIQVKIEGYDPRDLVRGHYLLYRVSVQERSMGSTSDFSGACAGSPQAGLSPVFVHDGVTVPGDCRINLPARFVQDSHRFYVQQDRALDLERELRDGRGSITVRVINDREVAVEDLLIDGVRYNK